MAKIIITGANGFLGLALTKRLLEEKENILAFLKNGENPSFFVDHAIPYVFGDVLDENSLARIIEPGDAIVHLAAIVSITGKNKKMVWDTNVRGTENVIAAAKERKAKRLVYVSSVHALPYHPGPIKEEDFWMGRRKSLGIYEKSKLKATELVYQTAGKELETTIIYPSGIIGPGDPKGGEISTLIELIAAGRLPAYVSGGYAFCDVRDVASAIFLSLRQGKGGAYIISGGYLTIEEIVKTTLKLTNQMKKPSKLPRFLAWAALPFLAYPQKMAGRKTLYTAYSLRITKEMPIFSTEKAKQDLGLSLRDPQESLRDEILYAMRMK